MSKKYFIFFISLLLINKVFPQRQVNFDFLNQLSDSLKTDTLLKLARKFRGEDVDKALIYSQKAYEYAALRNDSTNIGNAYNYIGNCNHLLGKYEIAMKNYLKAIEVFEKSNNRKGIASSNINIGVLCSDKGKDREAISYFKKAAIMSRETKNTFNEASCYNNIGTAFTNLRLLDSALFYSFKALEIREKIENDEQRWAALTNSYNNIAVEFIDKKDFANAEKYYKLAYDLFQKTNDNNSVVEWYNNMGDMYFHKGDYSKSLEHLEKAEQMALEEKLDPELPNIYYNLSQTHKKLGRYEEAMKYLEKYADIKDSLNKAEDRQIIEEMQAKYETDKKEQEINLLNKDNELKTAQLNQEKKIRIFFAGFAMVVLISAGLIYNAYRNKKKANELLKEKNLQIEHQRNEIADKNKEIVDSINYAKRLQEAIMPTIEQVRTFLPDSFILFRPKDIVAGDFYWMHTSNHGNSTKILIAAADCTGHGVPGSMVSVVCSNALQSSVKEFGLSKPGNILDKTSELVEGTFTESGKEVKDGMDISLACIEYSANNPQVKIEWAGANNPLWYIKDGVMNEIKADKQPVGRFDNRKPFQTNTIELKKGDSLYLFTDGFADQFGGPKGKKFKYKPFSELLLSCADQEPEQQKEIILSSFIKWKDKLEQIDDVCIIGIRL